MSVAFAFTDEAPAGGAGEQRAGRDSERASSASELAVPAADTPATGSAGEAAARSADRSAPISVREPVDAPAGGSADEAAEKPAELARSVDEAAEKAAEPARSGEVAEKSVRSAVPAAKSIQGSLNAPAGGSVDATAGGAVDAAADRAGDRSGPNSKAGVVVQQARDRSGPNSSAGVAVQPRPPQARDRSGPNSSAGAVVQPRPPQARDRSGPNSIAGAVVQPRPPQARDRSGPNSIAGAAVQPRPPQARDRSGAVRVEGRAATGGLERPSAEAAPAAPPPADPALDFASDLADDIDGEATVVAPPPDLAMAVDAAERDAASATSLDARSTAEPGAPSTERLPATAVALDGLADGGEIGGDSVDIPFADSVDIAFDEDESLMPSPRRHSRAQTEALSDSDLEEMMEPIDEDADPHAPVRAPGLPALEEPQGRVTEPPPGREARAGGDLAGGAPAPAADSGAQQARGDAVPEPPGAADDDDSDFDALATVQYVPSEAAEEPREQARTAAPAFNPADSGELLSDDMIEEIDDGALSRAASQPGVRRRRAAEAQADEAADAAPRDRAQRTSSPPPAPAQEPEPAEARSGEASSSPPPVPSASKKPPPAPAASAAPAPRPRRKGKPWFEEIFDEDYLRTLPFLTPQSTQFEANFVIESLAIDAGSQVLDVGCGYGRHAMELAARGYHVVGLDLSLPLLLRGADEAQRRGLTINFVHGDMRDLAFDSQFDGAYCLFSTFGYFDDEVNKKTAKNIARALKPGARFVLEVLNRDYLIEDLPARVWWEGDGCVVLEELDFNYFSSRIISNRSVVFDDGRQAEQEISLRAYSLHELGKLLHAAGFRVLEVSGNMTARGRFFGAKARGIVVVAERRPTDFSGEGTRPG